MHCVLALDYQIARAKFRLLKRVVKLLGAIVADCSQQPRHDSVGNRNFVNVASL
jgi:hypothetical protein